MLIMDMLTLKYKVVKEDKTSVVCYIATDDSDLLYVIERSELSSYMFSNGHVNGAGSFISYRFGQHEKPRLMSKDEWACMEPYGFSHFSFLEAMRTRYDAKNKCIRK